MSEPHRSREDRDPYAEPFSQAYKRTPGLDPQARERLEQVLAGLSPAAPRRRSAWSAARAMRAVVALAATLLVGIALGRTIAPARLREPVLARHESTGSGAPAATRSVEFVLVAPRASRVSVVGDFNGWDALATPMRRARGGSIWTASVTVPAGRHLYAFVTDGRRWVSDPRAPLAPANEFGFRNSVLVVGEPAS